MGRVALVYEKEIFPIPHHFGDWCASKTAQSTITNFVNDDEFRSTLGTANLWIDVATC